LAGNRFLEGKSRLCANQNPFTLISDRKIAILADDGVNQRQLSEIRDALEKGGVKTDLISSRKKEIKGWENRNWGTRFKTDSLIADSNAEDYDGVVIPGGALHADHLRECDDSRLFIRQFFASGKLVAALGHGVQVLIDSEVLKGRKITGSPSITTDLKNAGALLQAGEIAADNGLLTARNEKTVAAFTTELIDTLRKGLRQRTEAVI
jgi:protease I